VVRCNWVDPAVCVMLNVVLSQQNESRELLTARIHSARRGTHLREQVQDSVAHGTGGVSHSTTARRSLRDQQ
jgi:hypothetical protein